VYFLGLRLYILCVCAFVYVSAFLYISWGNLITLIWNGESSVLFHHTLFIYFTLLTVKHHVIIYFTLFVDRHDTI